AFLTSGAGAGGVTVAVAAGCSAAGAGVVCARAARGRVTKRAAMISESERLTIRCLQRESVAEPHGCPPFSTPAGQASTKRSPRSIVAPLTRRDENAPWSGSRTRAGQGPGRPHEKITGRAALISGAACVGARATRGV